MKYLVVTTITSATDGVIGKISLSWTPSDDQLYYVTWSEGFRSGFLNRPGGKGNTVYTVPFSYDTDDVTNYEFGWKLDLLDGNLRLMVISFLFRLKTYKSVFLIASYYQFVFCRQCGRC